MNRTVQLKTHAGPEWTGRRNGWGCRPRDSLHAVHAPQQGAEEARGQVRERGEGDV